MDTGSHEEPNRAVTAPYLPHLRQMVSNPLSIVADPSSLSSTSPAAALLQRASSTPALREGDTGNAPGHTTLTEGPEERVEELVSNGRSRRDALRQVARENMDAEIREGLSDTLNSGALPSYARACRVCCGVLVCVLLITALSLCLGICVCSAILHFVGWFFTWWLLGCNHQHALRSWLLLYQMLSLVEALAVSLVRGYLQECTEALDSRVRPGFARVCGVVYTVTSSALKVLWCLHAQYLVQHAPHPEGCGQLLPRFVSWYSFVLMLQLLVVEPIVRLGMSLALWAATNGLLATTRAAKPGTLEAMQVIEYSPDLFADSNDPSDSRPQKECCFCLEEYNAEQPIVRTSCQHLMHRECLGRWLQTSHFCPICRGDLEEARLP